MLNRMKLLLLLTCYVGNSSVLAQNSPPTAAQNANSDAAAVTDPTPGAATTPAGGSKNIQVINQPDGGQTILQTFYCPEPSDLIKNGLYWGTAAGMGGWKSYSESFDSAVASFIGAQWIGINVGKMVCIYKGNLSLSFPITIQNDSLSQTPSGGLWGNDLGGYRNCHSTNLYDCPFVVRTQSVNIQQIYRSLDFFKGKPNPLSNNDNQ